HVYSRRAAALAILGAWVRRAQAPATYALPPAARASPTACRAQRRMLGVALSILRPRRVASSTRTRRSPRPESLRSKWRRRLSSARRVPAMGPSRTKTYGVSRAARPEHGVGRRPRLTPLSRVRLGVSGKGGAASASLPSRAVFPDFLA